MRFEKWQALGNDYMIVERDELPLALTPPRIERICRFHYGAGADGILQIEPAEDPELVAFVRIFNPDGTEAELSGNGIRDAVLYLRRAGRADSDEFAVGTAAAASSPRRNFLFISPHPFPTPSTNPRRRFAPSISRRYR